MELGRVEVSTESRTQRKFGGDDFSQAIAKVAVAQICERVGFQTFQQSALGTLADIAVRYLHSVGKGVKFYANLSGRAEGNAFDIIQGLEDFGLAQDFSAASDIDHCLASSGIVLELIQYAYEATDVPFAYAIPRFPLAKYLKPNSSFLQTGEEPTSEDIPAWLPAFLDPLTYLELPTRNETMCDSYRGKIELGRKQQFSGNGPEGPSSFVHGDSSKEKRAAESNPFLFAPLHFEEKEVSSLYLPTNLSKEVVLQNPVAGKPVVGSHNSVMETFAPALEAMKCRFPQSKQEQKSILLDQRPPVQFKIGNGKKLVKPLKSSQPNMNVGKFAPWLCKDREKDEKKRRAAETLKDSTENTGTGAVVK